MIRFDRFDTPVGVLTVAADERGLRYVLFPENRHPPAQVAEWKHDPPAVARARTQLLEYFARERTHFELELAPQGTDFQQRVWSTLAEIPYGRTWSYADVARQIKSPLAVRAVGAANGRNPLPIVLPCHRVVGANRSLTGFGGGLATKVALLDLESAGGELAGAVPDARMRVAAARHGMAPDRIPA